MRVIVHLMSLSFAGVVGKGSAMRSKGREEESAEGLVRGGSSNLLKYQYSMVAELDFIEFVSARTVFK